MAGVGAESSGDGVFGDYGVYELSIVTESGRGLCDNLHGYTRLFCFVSFRFVSKREDRYFVRILTTRCR